MLGFCPIPTPGQLTLSTKLWKRERLGRQEWMGVCQMSSTSLLAVHRQVRGGPLYESRARPLASRIETKVEEFGVSLSLLLDAQNESILEEPGLFVPGMQQERVPLFPIGRHSFDPEEQ